MSYGLKPGPVEQRVNKDAAERETRAEMAMRSKGFRRPSSDEGRPE